MMVNLVLLSDHNTIIGDSSSNWISFIFNLSGVLIGAFLAYLIALYIEKRQRKHEREEEENKQIQLNNERLKYLIILLESVIQNAEKQSEEYFTYSNKIREDTYDHPLVSITLTNDIQRIKHLDNQKIFDAYTWALKAKEDRIKNYSKLFHQVDFLELRLLQMFDMNAKHISFTFNDQCYIRDIIDDLVIILTTIAVEITENYPDNYKNNPIYLFITDLLHKSSINSTSGLAYFEKEFIIPLRDNCRQMFGFDRGVANLVLEKTKRAIARLKHIDFNSKEHAKSCESLKSEIEPSIKKLIELKEEIKTNVP